MDSRIYICAHKEFTKPADDFYHPLQVGAALHDDLGYIRDDSGDNISVKNPSFCEMTGLYWLWKNVDCDIVGTCHYRRYFAYGERFLNKDDTEKLLQDYDIIVSNDHWMPEGSLYEHFFQTHNKNDIMVMKDIIGEFCPEYDQAFEACMSGNLFTPYNMLVAKKELFDEYCEWVFPLLFELEKRIDTSDYDDYQGRMVAFIAERMLRVWIVNHSLKVCELKVMQIDPGTEMESETLIEKKLKLMELSISDLLVLYKTGNPVDVFPLEVTSGSFSGKTPLWLCWFQGFENAPEIVQMCRSSLYKNMDIDTFEVVELTLDNIGDYIAFPDWIIDLYEAEKITLTQLSDMLRMSLLYYYGGVWVDSTYFFPHRIGSEHPLGRDDFYTIKPENKNWERDVTDGRWSGNFIKVSAGHMLPRFVMNAFYYYYMKNDKSADYFMIDYFIRLAYEHLPEVKRDIDSVNTKQKNVFLLSEVLNKPYSKKALDEACQGTDFIKLGYKKELRKKNYLGRETIYGHIVGEYL